MDRDDPRIEQSAVGGGKRTCCERDQSDARDPTRTSSGDEPATNFCRLPPFKRAHIAVPGYGTLAFRRVRSDHQGLIEG